MIKDWTIDEQGRAVVSRSVQHWKRLPGRQVSCNLCYRNCVLDPGQVGPCKVRENQEGKLVLNSHGVLSCLVLQRRGLCRGYAVRDCGVQKPFVIAVYFKWFL